MADELELPYIDTTKPSIARVYDYGLGGKDNFEVDREAAHRVQAINPDAPLMARAFRDWLIRTVRYLAGPGGIDQFLDCGSGLPTAENVHQVAQRINPSAQVVYVDNDPMVAAHGRALLAENEHTRFIDADLRYPAELLSHPVVTQHLDFNRPLALMQCATLHHLDDDERPAEIMAGYIGALPSGSYVALSHFFDPADGSKHSELAKGMEDAARTNKLGTGRWRTRAEIEPFFRGLELVEPGLVVLADWWPDGPRLKPLTDVEYIVVGGVGRKP